MTERTILSSFQSAADAQRAAAAIQQLGIEVAQVDTLQAFPGDEPLREAFPVTGKIPSLASLTLDAAPESRNESVLLAADPSASGMADGQRNVTGRNFLLTVVCDESLVDRAVHEIRRCNGYT